MKGPLSQFFRAGLSPYTPVKPPAELALEAGLAVEQLVKIDANENSFGAPSFVKDMRFENLHVYPDPAQKSARQAVR